MLLEYGGSSPGGWGDQIFLLSNFVELILILFIATYLPLMSLLCFNGAMFSAHYFATGGETIKDISRNSGAQVELARDQQGDPRERVFRIQGNPDQIQTAIQMIAEKAGIVSVIVLFGLTLAINICLLSIVSLIKHLQYYLSD